MTDFKGRKKGKSHVQNMGIFFGGSGHGPEQGWQYGTVRSEFAYYVPCTMNRTVPAYRTSVQVLKRTIPTYRTRTNTKKAYRTSVPHFLANIEAYRTVLTYHTVLPSFL